MEDKPLKTKKKGDKVVSEFAKRFKEFAEKMESTVDAFEKRCGLSCGQVTRCEKNIRTDILARIMRVYPDEDYLYLVTGIRRNSDDLQKITETESVSTDALQKCDKCPIQAEITFLKGLVKSQQDTIYQLSIGRK